MEKHRFNKMPEMRADDYAALLDSMRQFGYDDNYPIVFYENDILDGWNRYRAAKELDIAYTENYFIGTYEEAVDFVHRSNTRRNLTPNEHAELIGRYYEDIKSTHGEAARFAPSGRTDHLDETPVNTEEEFPEVIYEADEYSQIAPQREHAPSRKKAAHTYAVSESKVKRSAAYVRALDQVPDEVKDDARAGKISQAEVIRTAEGKPKPAPKPFDKKIMKRKIGAIAFEVEALADTFPDTREVCNRVLDLCRAAQDYTGV